MEYLTGLGFPEDQVIPLIEQAKKDLRTELARMDKIRRSPEPDIEALDRALHAIKGLLFNLGNNDLAEKLEGIRTEKDHPRQMLDDLDRVLKEAVFSS
jgi:hypothetical protein